MNMPIFRDAASELLRALKKRAGTASLFLLEDISSRPWASATFSGARHQIAFRLLGPSAEECASAFSAGVEAAEFTLRGHILADIELVGQSMEEGGVSLRLEALTVEDL
jgi:hypothetical protein